MARSDELNGEGWLSRCTGAAPPALRARLERYTEQESGPMPERLARAARQALLHVVSHPGDRSIALDLLAADGLITLALLAQAESDPATLGAFAATLLEAGVQR